MSKYSYTDDGAGINITPILDIVFIAFVFFILTMPFLKQSGPEDSQTSEAPPRQVQSPEEQVVVRIDASGRIYLDGEVLDRRMVPAALAQLEADRPGTMLLVSADAEAGTLELVTVLDAARAVGIESIDVETVGDP